MKTFLPFFLGRLLYSFSPNTRHRKNCLPLIRTNWQRRYTPPTVVTMALRKPRRFKTPHAIPSGSCWLPIPLPFSSANTSNRFASWKNRLIESTQKSHVCFLLFTTNLPPLGIGPTLAATSLSEIGDIRKFASPGKLAPFAGIDPTMKQSGNFVGGHVHMSKRGSPYLRRAIWLAATIAAFKDPTISVNYQRKCAEEKSHLTALGHVSRKMVNIIFAVLRDNITYSSAI